VGRRCDTEHRRDPVWSGLWAAVVAAFLPARYLLHGDLRLEWSIRTSVAQRRSSDVGSLRTIEKQSALRSRSASAGHRDGEKLSLPAGLNGGMTNSWVRGSRPDLIPSPENVRSADRAAEQYVHKRLSKNIGLPRFSLFYM